MIRLIAVALVFASAVQAQAPATGWSRAAREDAVEAALAARYGRDALALAEVRAGDRVGCGEGLNIWRDNHRKLLRLLERRVAGYGSRG